MRYKTEDRNTKVDSSLTTKSSLRVVSFNVRSCRGLDQRTDPERIAKIINACDADIVALQEVASQLGMASDTRQLDALAKETGLTAIPGPALMRPDAPCGTGLLHRLPVSEIQPIELSQPGREPRGALDVKLSWQGMTIRCITTHLGLRFKERRSQIQQLLALLAGDTSELLILAGDINEWWPWSRNLTQIRLHFSKPATPAPATFPSRLPFLKLDQLWLKSEVAYVIHLHAQRTLLTAVASDHLPLLVEIALTPQPILLQ